MKKEIMQKLFQYSFKLLEVAAPPLARNLAIKMFYSPIRYSRRPEEKVLLQSAELHVRTIEMKDYFKKEKCKTIEYVSYSWGNGRPVLLLHGWSGRGTQMGKIAMACVRAGFQAVTFDKPAHGDSSGKSTNILEMLRVVRDLEKRYGSFHAIIGHSLGGMVALNAVKEKIATEKIVTIGMPATMDVVFNGYRDIAGVSEKTFNAVRDSVTFVTERDPNEFSPIKILMELTTPGLILHDREDREVDVEQAYEIAENWKNSTIKITEGLGHRRILQDEKTTQSVVDFLLS